MTPDRWLVSALATTGVTLGYVLGAILGWRGILGTSAWTAAMWITFVVKREKER
jgi:predicted MFS family arabinose efflux permease